MKIKPSINSGALSLKFVFMALLSMLCILAVSLPSILVMHIGAYEFDEPYQILNALDYKNAPLAPLSNYLGYLYGSIFPDFVIASP
jgi:hypothetical protein